MSDQWDKEVEELKKAYDEENEAEHGRLVRAMREALAQPGALGLGTGSLPVSHVDFYIDKWETHLALCVPGYADKKITMIGLFLEDLRAMKAAANVRQPEENRLR